MDNITHSLMGMAIAEGAIQIRIAKGHKPSTAFRRTLYLCSIAANNIPDLDLLYSGWIAGKLGYLLHHRGFTHTFLLSPPQSALILGVAWLYSRIQRVRFTRTDAYWLLGIALLGPFFHVIADSWNSYGVHPFWPFSNRWFYGDAVIIVEPLIWIVLLPALIYATASRALQFILAAILGVALWLSLFSGFEPKSVSLPVTLLAIALMVIWRKLPPLLRILHSLALMCIVVIAFTVTSLYAKSILRKELTQQNPHAVLKDLILSPLPSNPFCWDVISVETEGKPAEYILHGGTFALLPAWLTPVNCPEFRPRASLPPLAVTKLLPSRDLLWTREFRRQVSELIDIRDDYCGVRSLLRFDRAPFWGVREGKLIFSDLRFDRGKGGSFASFDVKRDLQACPDFEPPWRVVRGDVFVEATR